MINEIGKAVANFSALPTELAEKPYAGLIFDAHTHRISVGRSALVRDIILKKYGFTKPSGDGDLNRRIKRSVGEAYSVDDFMW